MTYIPKSKRLLAQKTEFTAADAKAYLEYFEAFEELERRRLDLPEISLLGSSYFPHLIDYPICIAKELLKWAHSTVKNNDINILRWLVDNQHIQEEIRFLQKTLKDLGEDLEIAKKRGEIIVAPDL